MAKVYYPSWLDAISGRFGNTVFVKKAVLPNTLGTEEPSGYVRSYSPVTIRSIRLDNQRRAFKIVSDAWDTLNDVDKASWEEEARSLDLGYRISGRVLFMSYYLTVYANEYTTLFYPASLNSVGLDDYAHRDTRGFNSMSI